MNKAIRYAAALAAAVMLSGCAAVLVGGAAAGGYYAGKDERTAKQIAADSATTSSVKTKLITDTAVKALDVNVDTREGVVFLRGTVDKAEQRAAAERIARSVKGVKGVRNELRVK
ncbi:MAG: BON domain-containing protein [Gammaproteobacteria bacterium]